MAAKAGVNHADLWSEIIASEKQDVEEKQLQPRVKAIFQRRKPDNSTKETVPNVTKQKQSVNGVRVSIADPPKRVSWNRSLSTRGRESIAVVARVRDQPGQKQVRRKLRPTIPKPKAVQHPTFEKEIAYFKEVDAFELIEESPSPKSSTWVSGQTDSADIPQLASRLEKWLISNKLNYNCEPSSTLTKILETPATDPESNLKIPTVSCHTNMGDHSVLKSFASLRNNEYMFKLLKSNERYKDVQVEDLDSTIRKLSLTSTCSSLESDHVDPFAALLAVCGQSSPSNLLDVFAKYCDPGHIIKIGEGTFGEAFKAGNYVCKIVPIDGDFRVNGEVQKRSEELLEEAILSCTLNQLRTSDADACNRCTTFIETIELKVCQGSYDAALVKAWEEWDEKNGSENDHPQQFPEKQIGNATSVLRLLKNTEIPFFLLLDNNNTEYYVVFVLEHGGKDLESFVLLNSDEAQSLLLQVTAGLAVAETAYEFEHRDLHWGNILLSRNESAEMSFILDGEAMKIKTLGLCISIIDFTLSRINTGKDILFLDLSTDPDLFKQVKGNKQSETYRKMKDVTGDCWEESFPRTNVLWLQYLVDILLSKKSFERSSKKDRDFRSLKKRLDNYSSTKQALTDPFFSDLFINQYN